MSCPSSWNHEITTPATQQDALCWAVCKWIHLEIILPFGESNFGRGTALAPRKIMSERAWEWEKKWGRWQRGFLCLCLCRKNVHEMLLSAAGLNEKASRAFFKEASTSLADIFFSEMCIAWERNVTHCMWKIPSHCLLGRLCRQPLLYLFSLRTHTLSLALVFDTIPRAVNQPSCNAWLRWRGGVGCVAVLFHSTNVHSECQNRSGRNYKLCLETWV